MSATDLKALAKQTQRFLEATEPAYSPVVDPGLERSGLPRLGELRRADVPRFMRAPELDVIYPAADLVPSLERTLAGLGIDLRAQPNVHVDTERRPTKSPRAFCCPIEVPGEVHLVISPVGGHDDFAALYHEGGHTEHYAHVDAALPFEFRYLGDNSVTESFAFLMEHLTSDAAWLEQVLRARDAGLAIEHERAVRLLFVRRYCAKLAYELELHGPDPDFAALPERYAEALASATRVRWSTAGWLSDPDPGFYVARYLRAWALETHWRRALRDRFGEAWFAQTEAGEWLRGLWRDGQRLDADELLAETLGEQLEFAALADALVGELPARAESG